MQGPGAKLGRALGQCHPARGTGPGPPVALTHTQRGSPDLAVRVQCTELCNRSNTDNGTAIQHDLAAGQCLDTGQLKDQASLSGGVHGTPAARRIPTHSRTGNDQLQWAGSQATTGVEWIPGRV